MLICSWTLLPASPTRQHLWTTRCPITFCLWTILSSPLPAPEDTGRVSTGSPLNSLCRRTWKGKNTANLMPIQCYLREAFCRYSVGSSCQKAKGNESISENQACCCSPQIRAKNIQKKLHNTLLPWRNRKGLILLNLCRETKFQEKVLIAIHYKPKIRIQTK